MINLKTENWIINDIETVFIDKDGTFIDLHYFWGKITELRCKELILRKNLNSQLMNDLCLLLGYNRQTGKMLSDGITALYSRSKIIELFQDSLSKNNIIISQNELTEIFDDVTEKFNKDITKYVKPINSAIEFIKKLKKHNIKIGVITSDSEISTNLIIEKFKWQHLFDFIIGRESSEQTKESGALTKIAIKKLETTPKNCVMIGDAPMDVFSANNANVNNVILVTTGQIDKIELSQYSTYVVDSLKEVEII